MSVPRITQILEEEIQARFDSQDAAMREKATSDYLAFAILKELKKIRLLLENATGIELSEDDFESEEI
jgi:hypothetical protein